MKLTIKEIRAAVGDDLYDTVTNCSKNRNAMVNDVVAAMSDEDVIRAFIDAGLGDSEDEDEA